MRQHSSPQPVHLSNKGRKENYVHRVENKKREFLISNFRRVLYVVCFLLGNSPASEFHMSTFRNTLFHLHRQAGAESINLRIVFEPNLPPLATQTILKSIHSAPVKMEQSVPKRQHIKFRRRGPKRKHTKRENARKICTK